MRGSLVEETRSCRRSDHKGVIHDPTGLHIASPASTTPAECRKLAPVTQAWRLAMWWPRWCALRCWTTRFAGTGVRIWQPAPEPDGLGFLAQAVSEVTPPEPVPANQPDPCSSDGAARYRAAAAVGDDRFHDDAARPFRTDLSI